jgi:antiviral defense system Shedu protein SduA
LREIILSAQAQRMILKNPQLMAEIAENEELSRDIIAVGYRRKQIERFEAMMNDPTLSEPDWQAFFEENTWIFGYGLSYQFLTGLDGKKLEQVVKGFDLTGRGKRVDGLMKTRGRISSLCFVEIKLPGTPLLQGEDRPGSWAPSGKLVAAVAQVQNTVHAATRQIRDSLRPDDEAGDPTGEELYLFEPRSCLIVGNLGQFVKEQRVNDDKFRSFELYRRNTWRPEILTFDELLDRARFIVEHGAKDADDDMPF